MYTVGCCLFTGFIAEEICPLFDFDSERKYIPMIESQDNQR